MSNNDIPLSRRSVWTTQIGAILGLIAFVFLVQWATPHLHPHNQPASIQIGLLLVLIPAVLWLLLFYVQDHREPEPLHYVFRVAFIGAVLSGALGIPLIDKVFDAGGWLSNTTNLTTHFIGGVLIVGAIQEFCKYLAVRQVIYDHPEFDEVGDGIVYGTAAGLGVATMLNLHFVLTSPSIDSIQATLRIVVTALAHASFGGLMGYFLGRAKILGDHSMGLWGYVFATLCNGSFSFLLNRIISINLFQRSKTSWAAFYPENGLILAAALSVVLTLILFLLVRKHPRPLKAS